MADKELYGQLRDILVTINAVNSTFTLFSTQDIRPAGISIRHKVPD